MRPLPPETGELLRYLQVTGGSRHRSLAQVSPSDPTWALPLPWLVAQPVHTSQHSRPFLRSRHKGWLCERK